MSNKELYKEVREIGREGIGNVFGNGDFLKWVLEEVVFVVREEDEFL